MSTHLRGSPYCNWQTILKLTTECFVVDFIKSFEAGVNSRQFISEIVDFLNTMTRGNHFEAITIKINQRLGYLKQIRHMLSLKRWISFYNSLVIIKILTRLNSSTISVVGPVRFTFSRTHFLSKFYCVYF